MTTLHLLGLPHTITDDAHSHCAFTAKVLKFADMMHGRGYRIIHYGVEGADTAADEQVDILTRDEQNRLRGHDGSDAAKFVGDDANVGNALYKEFNARLRDILRSRIGDKDLVLLPFGHAHNDAVDGIDKNKLVEMGIGYPTLGPAPFDVFESYAWMHWHQGRANRNGKNYEWVVPNYFDESEWDVVLEPPRNRVVFLGRICQAKGLATVVEIAKRRPDLEFTICGQGDPAPWTAPNITYVPPLVGRERSPYLGRARALLMPTEFTEPFGGVAVEAMMCGTPAITTDWGAFTETVEDGVTGFRCRTLGDFLAALDRAPELDRAYIAARARGLYGFPRVAAMYDRVFRQIRDLSGAGWYSYGSHFHRDVP